MGLIATTLAIAGSIAVAAIAKLLADEGKAWLPYLIEYLIKRAVSKQPIEQQERVAEEWRSHVMEIPGDISKLLSVIGFQRVNQPSYTIYILNRMFALLLMVFLLPYLVIIPLWIKVSIPGPVFYKREKKIDGRIVQFLVFRTIPIDRANPDYLSSHEDLTDEEVYSRYHISSVGKFLRQSCIRELPYLISVLRGDVRPKSLLPKSMILDSLKALFVNKNE